ncbi:MAG: hypothetical protein ACLR23_04050 [Clostridia bacterium]
MPTGIVEMIKLAEKQEEKCTPARRGKAEGQRANGGGLRAGIVETSKPAEKQDKKCTPAR